MRSSCFVLVAVVGGCTPVAYTPPTHLAGLDSPIAPVQGGDAQVDLARAGQAFGVDMLGANARLRMPVSDHVLLEGDGGWLHVTTNGSGGNRNAGVVRGGGLLHGCDGAICGGAGAGVGAGYSPTAGGFTNLDVSLMLAGNHRWVRPIAIGDVSFNQPISARPFTISQGTDAWTMQLVPDVIMRVTFGLEAGPRDAAFFLAMSLMQIYANSTGQIDPPPSGPPDGNAFAFVVGFRGALDRR